MDFRRPPRKVGGNLLLSALFMAAFLFFLSVALVLTNREDIQYTLFVDHKMRSSAAADGMLDFSLNVMRKNSNWEQILKGRVQEFESGATGQVRWASYPGNPGQIPNPERYSLAPQATAKLAGLELVAVGQSGPFRSERHMILEEFRLADSLASDTLKPHLFALVGTTLQVLTPSFTWEAMTLQVPGEPIPGSLSADGGDLHCLVEGAGAQPPVIQDFTPSQLQSGAIVAGSFSPSATQIPIGQGAYDQTLENDAWKTVTLPDPGDQLGSLTQPTKSAGGGGDSNVKWDIDTVAVNSEGLESSAVNGPRISWYALTGSRASVHGGDYFCHGTHYFYSGFRFRNTVEGGNIHSQVKKSHLYKEPCILVYHGQAKKWEILLDYLKIGDPLEEPTIIPGKQPDVNTMVVTTDGVALVREAQAPQPTWYLVQKEQLNPSGYPVTPLLVPYGKQLLYGTTRWVPALGKNAAVLSELDPGDYFPKFLPILNASANYNPTSDFPGGQEPQINLFFQANLGTMTAAREDLYGLLTVVTQIQPLGQQPATTQTMCLAHFDGKRWQLLPAGLSPLLPALSSYRHEMSLDYAGGLGPAVGAQRLILAGYATSRPLLRRYVPVARFGS